MRGLVLLLYSIAGALLMSGFILVPGITRYAFSLGAILLGIRFFRIRDGIGARITFILLVVVLCLVFTSMYVVFATANDWWIPDVYKDVNNEPSPANPS
ncbi:MAG: hypothetical protein J7639_09155 [Paenibacillaceae bacterium]|nr:hypothetical protein [Paenibacillaceae bacterium]